MRLYEITTVPVDGSSAVAHVHAGNETEARELFERAFPEEKIGTVVDRSALGARSVVIIGRIAAEPEPTAEGADDE